VRGNVPGPNTIYSRGRGRVEQSEDEEQEEDEAWKAVEDAERQELEEELRMSGNHDGVRLGGGLEGTPFGGQYQETTLPWAELMTSAILPDGTSRLDQVAESNRVKQ
jgi:hypothetical protein